MIHSPWHLFFAEAGLEPIIKASVRWTLAATSSKTGGYNNFCPSSRKGKNANRVRPPAPKILARKSEDFTLCF